ncbi:DUF3558 domain-containing protein [Pseudonocardia sp. GCM10023141]|uniref:DUF3558 domain-containing protein n=1 Tax=Pseudonocardia sp. GCM10023141 TaxID=3252653 RepID=UPI00360F1F92
MNTLRRAGAGALLAVLVGGCSGQAPAVPATTSMTPTTTAAAEKPPPRFAPSVREPLDARGVAPCALLRTDQLTQLGLKPDSGIAGVSGAAEVCTWSSSTDPGNPAGLQLSTHPVQAALDVIYATRDSLEVFEPMVIAGHPAVRGDETASTGCVLYTAIADYQGLAVGADIAGRPSTDPCAKSRRMTELILSNLPPLR